MHRKECIKVVNAAFLNEEFGMKVFYGQSEGFNLMKRLDKGPKNGNRLQENGAIMRHAMYKVFIGYTATIK